MIKNFTLSFLLFTFFSAQAQLPDHSIAPDFTVTDLDGNEYNLYEMLASGKSVVIELTATWSYLGFMYHQGGALANYYETYGPDGSGEAVVLMIEANDYTTLEDLQGTGNDTEGDWLTGTPYPVVDDAQFVADLFDNYDFPAIIHICPNREITNLLTPSSFTIYQVTTDCLLPAGENNVGILSYNGFEGDFCGTVGFTPDFTFQNLGNQPLTNAGFEFYVNGQLAETQNWTGNLSTYETASVAFQDISADATTDLELRVANANGTTDDDPSGNQLQAAATLAPTTADNALSIEIQTDDAPAEIYWELLNQDGSVLHRGGNPGVFTDEDLDGAYIDGNTTYSQDIPLPGNGCYELVMYDRAGDGICCNFGFGYYRIINADNSILLQGGIYRYEDHRPFSLQGATDKTDNAAISGYDGFSGDFCGLLDFNGAKVFFKNLGTNDINSIEFELLDGSTALGTQTWNGNLPAGRQDSVTLGQMSIDASTNLIVNVLDVNGNPDIFDFNNEIEIGINRRLATDNVLQLQLQTDDWGYETYWQMTNSAGELIASGGNETIGPDGGGLQQAEEGQPGAYDSDTTYSIQIILPADVDDCYQFLIVDDYGDGLSGGGFVRMENNQNILLIDTWPTGTDKSFLIDAPLMASSTDDQPFSSQFDSYPNPASDWLNIYFAPSANTPARAEIFDVFGQAVLAADALPSRSKLDISSLMPGIYFLKMTAGEQAVSRKFLVSR
ncbi:MAG TPA: T9SS type A sorting domain-containing protein [Bacteroidetes bacterium]|nr:T9SS type A sorting domain-containing protein [Bacteroidota bacterium]